MTNLNVSENGVELHHSLGEELGVIRFKATDIRRERTGVHAVIAIGHGNSILAHDTFNIGRNEERRRLAKSAHGDLSDLARESYSLKQLVHDLDLFCLDATQAWESRFALDVYDVEETKPVQFALQDYLLTAGGTIMFGPPGTGKSYLSILMATSIATGSDKIWKVVKDRAVLYINLERSAESVKRRSSMAMRILGNGHSQNPVFFLNARGRSLAEVKRKTAEFTAEFPKNSIFVDSLSRIGVGSLVDDETANRGGDMLNALGSSWFAVGHTARSDNSHVFGSQMWDATEDIGIKLTSEESDGKLGVCLTVVKGNDIAKPAPSYYALKFENDILTEVEIAKPSEFPELLAGQKTSDLQRVIDYLRTAGKSFPTEIAQDTGVDIGNVSRLLHNTQIFHFIGKEEKHNVYSLQRSL